MSNDESDVTGELMTIEDLEQATSATTNEEPCTSDSISHCPNNDSSRYEQRRKIDMALTLNKKLDEKIGQLQNILEIRQTECHKKLKDIRLPQENSDSETDPAYCERPYFKDFSNCPAPDNEDTIRMKKLEMFDFSNIFPVPSWTVKDKCEFLKVLLKMSREIRKKELYTKIDEIQQQGKCSPKKNSEREKEISAIRLQIAEVDKKTLDDLALPIEQDYDWLAIAKKLKNSHNANECRGLWRVFLHPSINKKPWDKDEHEALKKIVLDQKMQDWEKIAQKLGTGRTGYQCFVYFKSDRNNSLSKGKWTKKEVDDLKRLIDFYRVEEYIPFAKIASAMKNRTRIQIYNKYLSLCSDRKGRFLPEEDSVILTFVKKFGTDFQKMAQYLPGRTSCQCRARYKILTKRSSSVEWTEKEDKRLIELMDNQGSSKSYSDVTKFFVGKDRIQIRSRHLILTRWMRKNPNEDISKAPRRVTRMLGHGDCDTDLNKAMENLKLRKQLEDNKIKSKLIPKDGVFEEDI